MEKESGSHNSWFGKALGSGYRRLVGIVLLVPLVGGAVGIWVYVLPDIRSSLAYLRSNPMNWPPRKQWECVYPTRSLVRSLPTDAIPSLTHPVLVPAASAVFLRPEDRVIGVRFHGEQRAYPLRILEWHECVNDSVGDVDFAVTYCPLCDSAFVFNRNVNGNVLEFGNSGMLFNSNVVLYDRQEKEEEISLWNQVSMRAICGPAAERGERLELLPSEVASWSDWKGRFPTSLVLSPETGYDRDYRTSHFEDYFASPMLPGRAILELGKPPRINGREPSDKERVLVVTAKAQKKVYPFEELARAAGEGKRIKDRIGEASLTVFFDPVNRTARVESSSASLEEIATAQTFWFAWKSVQTDYEVFTYR